MVLMPVGSRLASMMDHDGKDVVRLHAGGICFAHFFNKPPSKPQDSQQTRQAEFSGYWDCLRPLSKRAAGDDTSFIEA